MKRARGVDELTMEPTSTDRRGRGRHSQDTADIETQTYSIEGDATPTLHVIETKEFPGITHTNTAHDETEIIPCGFGIC